MAGAMAFIVSFGALGSFVGSWIVGYLNGLTGGPALRIYSWGVRLSSPSY